MSLTTCLKKMGATISPKDRAAILSLARGYRSQGLDPTAAAIQAVSDQAEIAQSRLAELSTADRPVESTPLPSKRADTPQTETENFKRWFGDSKVVDAEGKPLVVYHGTDREFTEFRMGSAPGWGRGIYFTDNRDQAEADYGGGAGGRVVEAYLSIRNPWRGGFPGYEEVEGTRAWQGYTGRFEDSLDAWDEDGRFAGEVLRELGYDGVIAENSNDIRGLEIVAFDPGQIKSATGNSGAFDPNNPSILFSKRVDDEERDLIVTHNLTAANLKHAVRMGGLAVPSLAVTRADNAITGFGDITLIGDSGLANPKAGAKAFGADVYSPRYPEVMYRLDGPSVKRLNESIGAERDQYWGRDINARDLTSAEAFKKHMSAKFGNDRLSQDADQEAHRLLREAGAKEQTFEGFTYSGNRRYKPHTLENVVKKLKKELRGGESFNYGVGSLRAKYTPQFRSIEALRKEKGRLQSKEEFKAVRAEVDGEFFAIAEALAPYSDRGKSFDFSDTVIAVMEDAGKMGVPRALAEYGMTDVPAETQQEIAKFLTRLRNMPTEYFEIIQPRAVQVEEFRAAVVPDDIAPDVREELTSRGLSIVEYKSGDDAARRAAVKKTAAQDSLMFSKRTPSPNEEATPKFNSATEFWTDNVGKPVFDAISKATKALIASDWTKRHGINLAEDMPPEAQKAWRAYKQDVGNLKKTVSEIADEAKKLTPEERAMVSDLVEREMKAGVTPPEAVIRMATLMTSIMRKQSQQLVETGMLSKDAADRWEGRYLPRFYQKHLLTNPFDTMLRKAYLSGIRGSHLKGRGLFETVTVKDVPAYEKMGWEIRDPSRGKQPDLKGLPEDAKVRVWRDFTPAERQKMGEVRDAMYRFARGYTDTQIDIAKGKLFDHIARTVARDDNPGGSYVLVPDTSVPGTGVKKFGNLAGKYVPGDVLSALKTKAGPDSDITRAYLKALSLWKEGRTSLNPVTHVNNVVSNLVMSDLAGVNLVDPRSWKLYADTFNDYRKEGTWFKEAQKAGMFGGEWYGNEVAQWLPLPSELKDSGPRSIPGKFAMKAVDAIGSVRRGMGKMYQAEDQFFKLLLYKQARERGLEPNDAVTWANKFVFDYSTAAPGVTKLKNTLFPFANYSSKAVPALTFAATHYPWRIAKWIGLLSGFSLYAFNTLYGDDEAEEMAESEAAMMPDYLKGRSSFFGVPKAIRLPYDDESTGDGMYVDISRFVPLGDLFDAENQSGGVPLPAPLTPNNPIITTAIAMLANKDSFTGKDIVRDSDTGGEAAQKRIGWLYRQMAPNNPLVPGSYNFNRIGQAVSAMAGEPIGPYTGLDYNGNTISPARALAQTFGIKLRSVDFEKEMHFQELDLKREISDLKGQKTKLKKNQSISDETLERELDKLDVKIEAVQTRLYDLQDIPIPQR